MPNSYSKNFDASNQPDARAKPHPWVEEVVSTPRIEEPTPVRASDAAEVLRLKNQRRYAPHGSQPQRRVSDATEVLSVENQHRYTPHGSQPQRRVSDATEILSVENQHRYTPHGAAHNPDDYSLSSNTMRHEQVVEDITYQAPRADQFAERRAVAEEHPRTASIRQPTTQEIAIERDTLEPVALRARRNKSGGIGSTIFFVGSAVITAIAAIITVMFLLPSQGGDPSQPVSGTSVSSDSSDSATQSTESDTTSNPGSDSQVSSTTDNGSEQSSNPGTVEYAPPAEFPTVGPLPEPAITLEEAPTEGEELPAEPSDPVAVPPEIVPPADASPNDEPDRPIETADPGENTGATADQPADSSTPLPSETPGTQ